MAFAQVIVDIPTRALREPFTYAVPADMEGSACVGCCVVVGFGNRPAVGYVVGLADEPPCGLDPTRVQPIRQVLSASFFDEASARTILWVAHEYAALPSEVARLWCPPGFSARMMKDEASGQWSLQQAHVEPADDRWVCVTCEAASYVPAANATAERALLAALANGPMRQVELGLEVRGAAAVIKRLERKGVLRVEHRRRVRGCACSNLSSAKAPRRAHADLTCGQREALAQIDDARVRGCGDVVLLDGVTGSGKTEVYLLAIERALEQGKGAVVLVPEISLTPQTVGRFRARFGDAVAVLHSRLNTGERFDQWEMVASGDARVVVGARSALFAPMRDPGLYIIDEEHESTYKQSSSPRYHAREVAACLAREHGAALVLGSATPSLEALAWCERGSAPRGAGARWTRVGMPERAGSAQLPPVEVVDMASEFSGGSRSMFSRKLKGALDDTLASGHKAVLMLNQRGFSRFVLCRDCGFVPRCECCSTSLTYHERGHKLMCHTCGREYQLPATCPECGSHYLRQFGAGTQRVEDALREELPDDVTIVRMDADTTKGKDGHAKCLEEFDAAGKAVLLGTQMIAKGLDFPEVTLVGVINADTTLKISDFRAGERTYGLLEQVAGRAGRGKDPGRVIIQTYCADHPAIRAAATHTRDTFTVPELAMRGEAGYPPFVRLANVLVWGPDEAAVRDLVIVAARSIRSALERDEPSAQVLGPVPCAVSPLDGKYRWHLLVRAPLESDLGGILGGACSAVNAPRGVNLTIDIDPHEVM